jgi:hypothetical protein
MTLYLFIGPVVSTVVQSVLTESNDPGSIVPDNAHGLGNPEPTTSLIDPSEEGTTQPETGRVSIETQVPNPLSTLIHIYMMTRVWNLLTAPWCESKRKRVPRKPPPLSPRSKTSRPYKNK